LGWDPCKIISDGINWVEGAIVFIGHFFKNLLRIGEWNLLEIFEYPIK